MSAHTYFIEISDEECERLLASADLGRLGVVVAGRPEIFPVNHVWDPESHRILFPTNESTKWRAALEWPWVAFEVDGMDEAAGEGWSVAAVGHAEPVIDLATIERAAGRRHVGWVAGPDATWLAITPSKLTGRRILEPPT